MVLELDSPPMLKPAMPPAAVEDPLTLVSTSSTSTPEVLSAPHLNFARCFVWNLDIFPVTNEKDAEAIENLTWALKSSKVRNWTRTKLPKLAKFFESVGEYPGRRVCAVHKNINATVLFNLMDIIRDETAYPDAKFCAQRLRNTYLRALRDTNLVWDKDYYQKNQVEIERVPKQLLPYENHKLFQENNCAGCCLRRILSDHNLVGALLAEAHFRTFHDGEEKEVTDYLEAVWQVLGERRPDLWDTKEKVEIARGDIETGAKVLWEHSDSFKKQTT